MKQTEELLSNGKVTSGGGRARALMSGTAFSGGSGGGLGVKTTTTTTEKEKTKTTSTSTGSSGSGGGIGKVKGNSVGSKKSSSSKTSSSKKKSSSSSSSKDDFKEIFDWIEIAIDRIERAINRLDQKANNVYKTWSSRNTALTSEIGKVGDEIELQQQAYDRYMKEANSVGLSSSWAAKVRDGKVDIETIKDEALAEKIKNYQTWHEKAIACQDAIDELKEKEAALYKQRFDNVSAQYDGILQGYEHTEAMLNEYISQAEEKGHIVSKEYYDALIANEKQSIEELKKEQSALIKARDEAVASGKIDENSEAWFEMCAEIDGVTQAIEESETALLSFDNAMRDIDWSVFDLIQERISDISEESEFLIELMSNKKLYEDDGKLTSQGLATMGLHAQNYNTHMYQSDEYSKEIAKLNSQIAKDPYDQNLINRRNELIEAQRESILAAEDEKNAIVDMVENGIELELEVLDERIQKYEEALDSQKDLYDYQKKVSKQTENIANLRKMLSAYENDDSEESKKRIQELKLELESAESDLAETEYDKLIQDTEVLLSSLYDEYSNILNSRLDNIDALLEQVIESINLVASDEGAIATALGSEGSLAIAVGNNATSIKETLTTEAKNVGISLSNSLNSIWSVGEGNAKSVLTMYGEGFQKQQTTTNATLNSIKVNIDRMVDDIDKDAQKKVTTNKTTTSAKKDPTKTTSTTTKKPATTTNKTTTTKSSGDGKAKVGDKVKFISGQYYYDSYGTKPLGSKYQGKEVYITHINTKGSHPYHISTGNKLGKGDLGWLKLNQLSGYASGKKDFLNNEVAWTQEGRKQEYIIRPSDGAILTPVAKGDSVLNATASGNIWSMANSPAEFIKNNLGLDSANVPSGVNVSNSITQNFENITFSMPNVHGYNDLLTEMQRDPKFEKLVLSMTIDRIAGRSSLAKGKSIR